MSAGETETYLYGRDVAECRAATGRNCQNLQRTFGVDRRAEMEFIYQVHSFEKRKKNYSLLIRHYIIFTGYITAVNRSL